VASGHTQWEDGLAELAALLAGIRATPQAARSA
jgi:hypothetical protein